MPKILIIDTYYPDFLKTLPFDSFSTYEVELRKVLGRSFGTADFYSRNLKLLGWYAVDVIANCKVQTLWPAACVGESLKRILGRQIQAFAPDVILLQDLSFLSLGELHELRSGDYRLAAQLSCPWPGDAVVRQMEIVFSSFPHYIPRIEKLGVRAVFNPLAFEPSVLDWVFPDTFPVIPTDSKDMKYERIHDCVFIGGVGNPSHWKYGMEVLETVAHEIPTFKWWGYGIEALPANSALRATYQGQAFGLDMYEILLQSKICLNRHGEVAQGYANNMRMFESTGCGAMLLTEHAPNLSDYFSFEEAVGYATPNDAVQKIRYYLSHDDERQFIADLGQKRTLKDHTYAERMKVVSETLKEMLCPA